ncbi:MAG: crotonase/enoyl-CoA hydratase family protein [Hyphomicrobiales bacterium]|nr:crotonase/enoyl-CoA hydratase family protein [Hyphomicrobiales bacterium]
MTASAGTARSTAASPLALERRGDVLIVGLDRQAKRNALNDETIEALDEVFSGVPDDVRAVVIHGIGPNFSAGLDLSEISERDVTEGVFHSRAWHRCFEKIEFGRTPVVAVLKGAVIGGGLELACAAHVRVAEASAFYGLPEGQRGIFVGGGGSVRLPKLIGVARMADMMLTGRTYSAAEGVGLGFSQYLVGEGEGFDKGLELATKMCGNAPLSNFAVIQALPRIADSDPRVGYLMESLVSSVAQSDREAKRRVRDFLEKRAAKVTRPD